METQHHEKCIAISASSAFMLAPALRPSAASAI
jgi:hypothetical protein